MLKLYRATLLVQGKGIVGNLPEWAIGLYTIEELNRWNTLIRRELDMERHYQDKKDRLALR